MIDADKLKDFIQTEVALDFITQKYAERLLWYLNTFFINDRPAPDQKGAEEVKLSKHNPNRYIEIQRGLVENDEDFAEWADSGFFMRTQMAMEEYAEEYARNEVAKAVEAKDAEIEKWKKDHKDLLDLYIKADDELTEAKKRIEELENRTEMKLPPNYERQ